MHPIIDQDIRSMLQSPLIEWEQFAGKTVLLTGASGMLPSYMAFCLLYLNRYRHFGTRLVAVVRNGEKAARCFQDFSKADGLEILVQDVAEPLHVDGPVDYVVHAASQAAPSYYGTDPVGTLRTNLTGTLNLLELAREKQAQSFLYFSSSSVYGLTSDELLREEAPAVVQPLEQRSCYPLGKAAGENLCVAYHQQYGLPTRMVRIFHTLGPLVNLHDGRIFSDLTRNVIEGKDLVLHSNGLAKRTFCYVADAAVAYFKVLLDGTAGTVYNVGGGPEHEISMKSLAEMLVGLYPDKHLHVIYDLRTHDRTYTQMRTPQMRALPDLQRIRSLGWEQQYDLSQTFQRTIDAHEAY